MPSTDSGMTSLETLPPKDGYGAGDIVNVKGVLYVLVKVPVHNEFHGTAGLTANKKYLGACRVGEEEVGSFVDPKVKGEVTWIYSPLDGEPAVTGVPLVRLRIMRAAFDGDPPKKLYVTIRDKRRQNTKVEMKRDSARDATEVYARGSR